MSATKRILVIDDDRDTLELLQILLEAEGHEVVTLASGEGAVEQLQRLAPDLVLLDVVMRPYHGLDVLRDLRAVAPRVPVILLSGLVRQGEDMREVARLLGACDFLEKPFDAQQLFDVVNRVL
ncbi:MAG TPA: response regulator [Chloroflexota bacterium]|nr:response regulator [Chloroflexota bacterium]HZU06027.1 response regulator [Chloroflexota bacterium]